MQNPDSYRQRRRDNVHEQTVLRVVFVLEFMALSGTRSEIKDKLARPAIKDQGTTHRDEERLRERDASSAEVLGRVGEGRPLFHHFRFLNQSFEYIRTVKWT